MMNELRNNSQNFMDIFAEDILENILEQGGIETLTKLDKNSAKKWLRRLQLDEISLTALIEEKLSNYEELDDRTQYERLHAVVSKVIPLYVSIKEYNKKVIEKILDLRDKYFQMS